MTFFSKLFGTSRERTMDRLLEESRRRVDKEYGPMGEVCLAITKAATNSRDLTISHIIAANDKERKQIEVFVFYEFLYFYMHMTMRAAAAQLSAAQINKLQEYLGPIISTTAIDSYCAHWPDDLKQKMIGEFYDNLNKAEIEYSECTRAIQERGEEGARQRMQALFISMTLTITKMICDGQQDVAVAALISQGALDEWEKMQLAKLINDVKNAN